jgi:hypothetical protein
MQVESFLIFQRGPAQSERAMVFIWCEAFFLREINKNNDG